MLKKLFSIFLLFIISIQCLPVKEIGKFMFDTTITDDELSEKDIEKEVEKKQQNETIKDIYCIIFEEFSIASSHKKIFINHTFCILPSPAVDVTTPPPNS